MEKQCKENRSSSVLELDFTGGRFVDIPEGSLRTKEGRGSYNPSSGENLDLGLGPEIEIFMEVSSGPEALGGEYGPSSRSFSLGDRVGRSPAIFGCQHLSPLLSWSRDEESSYSSRGRITHVEVAYLMSRLCFLTPRWSGLALSCELHPLCLFPFSGTRVSCWLEATFSLGIGNVILALRETERSCQPQALIAI